MSSFVYFIQAGQRGPIKIGKANDVEKRLAALQVGNPVRLEIIGVIECERAHRKEAELHRKFSGSRLDGEWFQRSYELENLISSTARPYLSGSRLDVSAAAAALGLSVIQIPQETASVFRIDARRNRCSAWEMLYQWLSKDHGDDALHNRTRVGDVTMDMLCDIESSRLRFAIRQKGKSPSDKAVREALSWSNMGSGPMTTNPTTGAHLVGEGLFVLPVGYHR